jgi:hypothetical protein
MFSSLFKKDGSEFIVWMATAFAITGLILISDSRASTSKEGIPMIQIGSGIENSGGGMNVLLRVNAGYIEVDTSSGSSDPFGSTMVLVAHIQGNITVSGPEGQPSVAFADITFAPIESQILLSAPHTDVSTIYGKLQVLPTQFQRNIAIDQAAGLNVSLIGMQIGVAQPQDESIRAYAQVAASALGYAMAAHMNPDLATFHGLRFVGTQAEAGVLFSLSREIRIRVSAGGTADLNWWGKNFQTTMSAYAALRADFTRYFQVFAQAGINAFGNTENNFFQGAEQVMVGVSVAY